LEREKLGRETETDEEKITPAFGGSKRVRGRGEKTMP